jgi:hypothetical protein
LKRHATISRIPNAAFPPVRAARSWTGTEVLIAAVVDRKLNIMGVIMENHEASSSSWRLLYKAGAFSAFAYVLMIAIPIVLLAVQPQAPLTGGAAILEYIAAHKAVYLTELVCFVGLSLPAVFVFIALGVALWQGGRSLALLGAVVGVGSELIALALGSSPPTLNAGLLGLSAQYATASDALKPSLAAAASALAAYANAISAAGILTALGILLLSVPMTRGPFPTWVGVLGIVTGALGILFEALRDLVGAAYGLYGILLPLWFVLVGLGLIKLLNTESGGKKAKD